MNSRIIGVSTLLIAATTVTATGDHFREVYPAGHAQVAYPYAGYHHEHHQAYACNPHIYHAPQVYHGRVRSYARSHYLVPHRDVHYRRPFPRSQWVYEWDDQEWDHRSYDDWDAYQDDRRKQLKDYREYQEDLREEQRDRWKDRFDD